MRILVSSAGLAAFASSSASAGGHDESPSVFDAATSSRVARDVDESYKQRSIVRLGEECVPTPTSDSNTEGGKLDVGVLFCEEYLSCATDNTSSTGGRCTKTLTTDVVDGRPMQAIFRKNRRVQHITKSQPRNLQTDNSELEGTEEEEEEEFVCPMNCPQEFCDCAEEFGEAKQCAEELDSICRNDQLRFCTPEKYKDFYDAAYCPFAECLTVDKDPFEDCACHYYRNYCTLYYEFEQSFDACETADCCQELPTEEKHTCLPELAPTTSPTGNPTLTQAPSVSPTDTLSPTTSSKPTISSRPTGAPTMSAAPTISFPPTAAPSDTPTGHPTISPKPTDSPTVSPTTASPSASPTEFPTGFPSESPSESPSASPTTSPAPTVSFQPTVAPTLTVEPTTSTAPTDAPSLSGQPTLPPSLLPTTTQPPSASPTTPPPTLSPSKEPTKNPTKKPSNQSPSTTDEVDEGANKPADEDNSVVPPTSSSTVAKCVLSTLFLGVGGVFWLLA